MGIPRNSEGSWEICAVQRWKTRIRASSSLRSLVCSQILSAVGKWAESLGAHAYSLLEAVPQTPKQTLSCPQRGLDRSRCGSGLALVAGGAPVCRAWSTQLPCLLSTVSTCSSNQEIPAAIVTVEVLDTLKGIRSGQCVEARGEAARTSWSCSRPLLTPIFISTSFQQEDILLKIKEMKPCVGHTPVMPAFRRPKLEERQCEASWGGISQALS